MIRTTIVQDPSSDRVTYTVVVDGLDLVRFSKELRLRRKAREKFFGVEGPIECVSEVLSALGYLVYLDEQARLHQGEPAYAPVLSD